jgi:hypothetical protein
MQYFWLINLQIRQYSDKRLKKFSLVQHDNFKQPTKQYTGSNLKHGAAADYGHQLQYHSITLDYLLNMGIQFMLSPVAHHHRNHE